MYRYSDFERILTLMFYIRQNNLHTFRSRLKYFRRLGMFKAKPGSGNKIIYEYIDLCEWSFILELSEFGIDPSKMALLKIEAWPKCVEYFSTPYKRSEEDQIFVASPVMFSVVMREEDETQSSEASGIVFLNQSEQRWLLKKSALADALGRRALVINLASIQRRLAVAIEELSSEQR